MEIYPSNFLEAYHPLLLRFNSLPVIQRVGLVFSAVFGLVITSFIVSAMVYRHQFFSYFSNTPADPKSTPIDLSLQGKDSLNLPNKPPLRPFKLSPHGSIAFQSAYNMLTDDVKEWAFFDMEDKLIYQPIDRSISKFTNIYNSYLLKFRDLLIAYPIDPWKQVIVKDTVSVLINVSFTMDMLMLWELESYTDKFKKTFNEWTPIQMLSTDQSYQSEVFFSLPDIYHNARGAVSLQTQSDGTKIVTYPSKISPEHEEQFYQDKTVFCTWRMLYNEYCDRIRTFVKPEELKTIKRFDLSTQKDLDKSFDFNVAFESDLELATKKT